MSKPVHKCPACKRRVRSAPYVRLQEKHTRKITRYHGSVAGCLEAATVVEQRRGLGEIVLGFYHAVECGDPSGKFSCKGGCFVAPGELEDLLLATASPGKAKIVKVGEE